MKKILALVLALMMCLTAMPAFAEAEGDVLNLAMASNPETIDPTRNSAVDGAVYAIHQFEPLYRYNWDGDGVEPGMAESHEVSEDGMVWTFHLRDSKWSDGEPVTAYDFEYAYRRLVDPQLATPYGGDMGSFIKNGLAIAEGTMDVEELGVKAIDEKTFEVTLSEPCPFFLEIIAFPVFSPIRQDIIEKYGDDDWVKSGESFVTNGAFMMESFTLDESMVSVPNPGYWDAASIKPSKLNWLFLTDDKAELAALRSGEADFIDGFPQEESKALEADGLYGLIPQLGTYYVNFNNNAEPFTDARVRKAFALSIDTKFIAEVLREGSVIAGSALVGPGFRTSGHDEEFTKNYIDPETYEANCEEAKALLAEAGYPNGEGLPKIEYLLNDNTGHIMIGEALQKMWGDVLGADVEIRIAEWAVVLTDRREGNFQVARDGWIGDYNDPATMLTLFLSTSGNNSAQYNNPAYDAKIAESMSETDPAKRNAMLREAEDMMIGEDWACAPIYFYSDEYGVRPDLKDWAIMPLGYKFFHKAYIEK